MVTVLPTSLRSPSRQLANYMSRHGFGYSSAFGVGFRRRLRFLLPVIKKNKIVKVKMIIMPHAAACRQVLSVRFGTAALRNGFRNASGGIPDHFLIPP